MNKTTSAEALARHLSLFLGEASAPPDQALIRTSLEHRSSYVVSKAAACVARHRLALSDDLIRAFARFLTNGSKTDKGCVAKKAICRALDQLEYDNLDWFRDASRCVQQEPVFGGQTDTAVDVRTSALRAMIRFHWFSVAIPLVRALGDPDPRVRIAGIETICSFGGRESELIILAKTVSGDSSPEVAACCFSALIGLNPENSIPIVAEFLFHHTDDIGLEAAFALGQSRDDRAFDPLRRLWDQWTRYEMKKVVISALSMLRTDRAVEFLGQVAGDRDFGPVVTEAVAAFPPELRLKILG